MSKGTKFLIGFLVLVVLVGAAAGGYFYFFDSKPTYEGLITHTVHFEPLQLTIVERGFLESAENSDVICRVKSGAKNSTVATSIRWIVDNGVYVQEGDKLIELDDSGLQEELKTQKILVDQANADWISASENFKIVQSQGISDIETARTQLQLAEINLEKFLGRVVSTEHGLSLWGSLRGPAGALNASSALALLVHPGKRFGGEHLQTKQEIEGRLMMARSDQEMWEEKAAWSQRMWQRGYVTASQAQADSSRLQGARLGLRKVEEELRVLEDYTFRASRIELEGLIAEARRALDRNQKQAVALEAQAEALRKAKESILSQESIKLREIEEEIEKCVLYAPQSGLVVYHIPQQSRFGSGSQQSIIAQGEPVREGQKMMQIPDLSKMIVKVKVHEALMSQVRGDRWEPTGFNEAVRATMMALPGGGIDPFSVLTSRQAFSEARSSPTYANNYREVVQRLASPGLPARVSIEALRGKVLKGHVKVLANTASQMDYWTADVRVYETEVAIDEEVKDLKPGMSAEVTIFTDAKRDRVLAVPLQAIVGGVSMGNKRRCYVLTDAGPEEREIEVGISNETKAEVVSGLEEGDRVVINPHRITGEEEPTYGPTTKRGQGGPQGRGGQPGGAGRPGGGRPGGGASGGAQPGGRPSGAGRPGGGRPGAGASGGAQPSGRPGGGTSGGK